MDKLVVTGGIPLIGTVAISGAKNAALPSIAASILTGEDVLLENIPHVQDVSTMTRLLESMGARVHRKNRRLLLNTSNIHSTKVPYELVKTMRASSIVLGPLLARFGNACVSLPGGCTIGARPIDLHLKALTRMGAEIKIKQGYIYASSKRLKGALINFDTVTVTGTENIMMAATLADGQTTIENAAREPEVADLATMLTKMGAIIEGAGTDRIVIHGVKFLHSVKHTIIPDRIEAGTFIIAAGITGGTITIKNCPTTYLESPIDKFAEVGLEFYQEADDTIIVKAPNKPKSVNITTAPYPGFATDLQAQFTALMTVANGTSIITETIFENRFMHVSELKRLGADITIEGPTAIVKGVSKLSGAPLMATDLRASASLVIAALVAEGTTEINRIYHLDRGYERIEDKLLKLGADIKRMNIKSATTGAVKR